MSLGARRSRGHARVVAVRIRTDPIEAAVDTNPHDERVYFVCATCFIGLSQQTSECSDSEVQGHGLS